MWEIVLEYVLSLIIIKTLLNGLRISLQNFSLYQDALSCLKHLSKIEPYKGFIYSFSVHILPTIYKNLWQTLYNGEWYVQSSIFLKKDLFQRLENNVNLKNCVFPNIENKMLSDRNCIGFECPSVTSFPSCLRLTGLLGCRSFSGKTWTIPG